MKSIEVGTILLKLPVLGTVFKRRLTGLVKLVSYSGYILNFLIGKED